MFGQIVTELFLISTFVLLKTEAKEPAADALHGLPHPACAPSLSLGWPVNLLQTLCLQRLEITARPRTDSLEPTAGTQAMTLLTNNSWDHTKNVES